MARRFRAFISYRRGDAFVGKAADGQLDFTLVAKVKKALKKAGFKDVFLDTAEGAIQPGDQFEGRIHREITSSDLFVPLIGKNWLAILKEKEAAKAGQDILVREVRAAIKQEKEIVPILVDGAAMPSIGELPESIRSLQSQQAEQVASNDSVDEITAKLKKTYREVFRIRKLGPSWTRGYIISCVAIYFLCALFPNYVGYREFGESWTGLAYAWSNLFIWPIFFLPFALLALYRPLTVLIESTTNALRASRTRDALMYATPLTVGTVVAVLGVVLEVGPPQTPWTIQPVLSGCEASGAPAAPPALAPLSSYDLQSGSGNEFWLEHKCWPNVFYYLTAPVYRRAMDDTYRKERPAVARAFANVIDGVSYAPYSNTFFAYVISIAILFWLLAVSISMAVLYVTVNIYHPDDNKLLKIPSEDAYLCLTYAFVTMMIWVPFRIHTIYFKQIYNCKNIDQCASDIEYFFKDGVLALALLLAFVFVTAGLVKYRRLALGLLGSAAVALIVLGAGAVLWFPDQVASLASRLQWQLYLGFAIVVILIMPALWYQFDPATVRFNDFRKDFER